MKVPQTLPILASLFVAACTSIIGFPDVPDAEDGGTDGTTMGGTTGTTSGKTTGTTSGKTTGTTSGKTTGTTSGKTTTTTGTTTTGTTNATTGTTNGMTTTGTTTGTTTTGATTTTGTTTGATTTGTTTGTTTTGTTTGTTTTGTTTGTTTCTMTSTCKAATTGGLPLTCGYMAASALAMGGYVYAYTDATMGGPSTACVDLTAFCGNGSSGPYNPPDYTYYGGGIGVNLNQAMTTGGTMDNYTLSGSGITYALSNLPTGAELVINEGTLQAPINYCAILTSASGTVPWSAFNTRCYDFPPDGTALSVLSAVFQIEFQISSGSVAMPWDFCVTQLSFAP